jgi:signal transduction histidine kinase
MRRKGNMRYKLLQGADRLCLGLAGQLLCTYIVACGVTIFMSRSYQVSGDGFILSNLPLIIGGLTGFLLTFNILYGLYVVACGLEQLNQGLPLTLPRRYWPFTSLFTWLVTLEHYIQMHTQEQRIAGYQQQLLQQIHKMATQEERNRLARDLHDTIKQQLFSITMSAATAKARWEHDQEGMLRAIDDIIQVSHQAQIEMQALLQQLRPAPLENVGLVEALRLQCDALQYRAGVQVHCQIDPLPSEQLFPLNAQEEIFRIVQEAFSNVARHARAMNVWLTILTQDKALSIEIRDDGQGFLPLEGDGSQASSGMGLRSMRERVQTLQGTCILDSTPGKGTSIHVSVPLYCEEQASFSRREEAKKSQALLQGTLWILKICNVYLKVVTIIALIVIWIDANHIYTRFFVMLMPGNIFVITALSAIASFSEIRLRLMPYMTGDLLSSLQYEEARNLAGTVIAIALSALAYSSYQFGLPIYISNLFLKILCIICAAVASISWFYALRKGIKHFSFWMQEDRYVLKRKKRWCIFLSALWGIATLITLSVKRIAVAPALFTLQLHTTGQMVSSVAFVLLSVWFIALVSDTLYVWYLSKAASL